MSSKKENLAKIVADKIKMYLNSSKIKWYSSEGLLLNTNNRDETYAISHALEKIFSGNRTRIRRPELNKTHNVPKSVQNPLEEAVNRLLNWKNEIVWDVGKAKDTADIMFFKDVLVYANVIRPVEVIGTVNKGKIVNDISVVDEFIPLLPKLIECVNDSKRGISLNNLIKLCDKHGVGYVSKMLFFATMIRYFTGSFYIKNTPQSTDTVEIQTYDVLQKYIIENKYPNSVIEILELTNEELKLIADIYHIFNDVSLTTNITLKQSYRALKEWYEGIPSISKIPSIYSEDKDIEFLKVMGTINSVPMQAFLLSKLQIIAGSDEKNDLTSITRQRIVEKIRLFKMDIDKHIILFKESICSKLAILFDNNAASNINYFSSGEIKHILMNWYNGLDDIQRDLSHSKHDSESKSFIKNLHELSISNNVDLILFENLLLSLGLQKLLDWKIDKSADLIAIIKRAKLHIETEVVDVENPKLKFNNTWSKEMENSETILYFNSEEKDNALTIESPTDNIVVYFTDNEKDPTLDKDRKEVHGKYKYIPLKDEITLRLVSMDENGRYGNINTYILKSKKKKFAARVQVKESQLSLDDNYTEHESSDSIFVPSIPTDYQSLEICLESIVEISRTRGKVSSDLIAKVLKNLIEKVN